jgi:hypothetical protein
MAADSPNQPQAPTPVVNAVAPDPAKCRAEALFPGSRTARCLAEQSQTYRFFVTLDHRAMCSHPQDGRIVARTLAEKPPAPTYARPSAIGDWLFVLSFLFAPSLSPPRFQFSAFPAPPDYRLLTTGH